MKYYTLKELEEYWDCMKVLFVIMLFLKPLLWIKSKLGVNGK